MAQPPRTSPTDTTTCSNLTSPQRSQSPQTGWTHWLFAESPAAICVRASTQDHRNSASRGPIRRGSHTKKPFIRRLSTKSFGASAITARKQLFGEHGIPTKLISDNGQYDCNFGSPLGFPTHHHLPQIPPINKRFHQTHGPNRQEDHEEG